MNHKTIARSENRLLQDIRMNSVQFDNFKSQLQQLTPQQLRALQGAISHSLEVEKSELVTSEELELISKLFS